MNWKYLTRISQIAWMKKLALSAEIWQVSILVHGRSVIFRMMSEHFADACRIAHFMSRNVKDLIF